MQDSSSNFCTIYEKKRFKPIVLELLQVIALLAQKNAQEAGLVTPDCAVMPFNSPNYEV